MTQQAHVPGRAAQPAEDPTIGALVHQLSEDVPALVRSEFRLAQAEVAEKGKRVGIGLGMFSAAGLLGFFAVATLVAAAVLALAEALPGWASALIVAGVLLACAGLLGLLGKEKVGEAQLLMPERAVAGVHEDIATLKDLKP
jgi:MFS family permease